MDNFIRITIVMEMLLANLITVNACATRKYSKFKTLAALLGFTTILTYFTKDLWAYLGFDEGNASFALIGIVYLIPLAFLYKELISSISSILFSAWIYTLIVFCSSAFTARLLPFAPLTRTILIVQTILYAFTYYPFTLWIRKGLVFILKNIARKSRYILQIVSLCWFFSIVIIQAALIHNSRIALNAAVVLTMVFNSVLSYLLLYSMVLNQQQIRNLEYVVYTDNLTGLPNRACLFQDLPLLIEKGSPFRLFFIDLNHFKQINDNYGHQIGDQYLICFSNELKGILGRTDKLYRMSGDEFIIISRAESFSKPESFLLSYPDILPGLNTPFLGMSIGWADYPTEALVPDKLITLADSRMYQNKQSAQR